MRIKLRPRGMWPYLMVWLLALCLQAGNAGGQYFSTYDVNKDLFVRKVKIIEEFIERFNDDQSTYLRKALAGDSAYNINRGLLLVSLFNLENTAFTDRDTALKGFFRTVLNKTHPVYLSFNDTDWYATAQCVFMVNGHLTEIPLTLRVRSNGEEWAKWMIAGIGERKPSSGKPAAISIDEKSVKMPPYLPTSAYATDFVELHHVFSRQLQPELVFEEALLHTALAREMVQETQEGKLKFQYVKKLSFQFLTVPGWQFTVDLFKRNGYNSGWLISSISKATDEQKTAARRALQGQ